MAASADSATLRPWVTVRQGGGSQHQAEAYVTNMSRTVDNLPKNARQTGHPKPPIGVTAGPIRIEEPLKACDVQQVVADQGCRPANSMVWERSQPRVAPTNPLFFDNGGLWDRLLAKSR